MKILSTSPQKLAFLFTVLTLAIAVSCKDDNNQSDENGKIQFSFFQLGAADSKIATNAASLLISVKDNQGHFTYEKTKITLYNFNGEFLSEPLSFKTGKYSLVEFLVIDETNNIIYASPLEGSKLAYLVKDPLPIDFTISKDETVKLSPEVLAAELLNPLDFGYATFAFDIVKTFKFNIAVFAYDDNVKNFELTTSTFTVLNNNSIEVEKDLSDSTHSVMLNDDNSNYVIKVTKANYQTYSKSFSVAELKSYDSSKVLIVNLLAKTFANGLVGEYLFNGNTDDTSGKNHHGINSGSSLTTDRKGNVNAAYHFNGLTSRIKIPDNSDMNFGSDQNFSISLWTLIDSTQSNEGNINDIIRKWNGDAQGYPFAIAYVNKSAGSDVAQRLIHVRYDGAGCLNSPTSYSPVVSNNNFHHVVLTKNGNLLTQYLDNVLVSEFNDNTTCATGNDADITIGCRGQLARFFAGKIDDVRIYSRSLSSLEVDVLFKE